MVDYARSPERLIEKAILFWPKELVERESSSSIIPLLIETQDKFISLLDISDADPQAWQVVLQATNGLSANLFLKHLMVLADVSGERLKRLRFGEIFPTGLMRYSWHGQVYEYHFEVITKRNSISNSSLAVDGKKLIAPRPLNNVMKRDKMAHLSEDSIRLNKVEVLVKDLQDFATAQKRLVGPEVYLFCLPPHSKDNDAAHAQEIYEAIHNFCLWLPQTAVVCVLTTPPDAARLMPSLEKVLKFQLWIAVKTQTALSVPGQLDSHHLALLVLTRYRSSLQHTKTRIRYTYCPWCQKTTKDYGGKKHTYHEYGTLMSDVWRDIACDLDKSIDSVVERLQDLFGLAPHKTLYVIDWRFSEGLKPATNATIQLPAQPEVIGDKENSDSSHLESRLLNTDCLEGLKSIPGDSVDFCFADPPYNVKKKYSHWNDSLELVEYFAWCDQWLSELARVLKPGRTLAVINIPLWAIRHYQYLSSILNFQAWIAWDAISVPMRMIMPSHYPVLCFSKGYPRALPGLQREAKTNSEIEYLSPMRELYCLRSSCVTQRRQAQVEDRETVSDLWHDIHRVKHNSYRVDHPTQLPPMLMRRLFALFTRPGEVVLDCFNGAGTSTLVAEQMGRKFIGIELSPQYHAIAEERHRCLRELGEDPFGKHADHVPTAKNSRVERLPKQRYAVPKKTLQLDVKRIAQQLGRLPTRAEVESLSHYPIEYFDNYFVSWGEVCAAARTTGMSERQMDNEGDVNISAVQLSLFKD